MKNNVFSFALLCISLCSCDSLHKFYNPDVQRDKGVRTCYDTLRLNEVQSLSTVVYNLLCIDDYLIMAQRDKRAIFRVLDVSTDVELAAFGQLGHAQNEFEEFPFSNWQIYCTRDEKGAPMLCVQDGICTKVIDLRKSIETKNCVIANVIKDKNESRFHNTYHLSCQKQFVYKRASFDDPRDHIYIPPEFYIMDGEEKRFDIYPNIVNPEGFPQSADVDYDNTMVVSPDVSHIACVNRYIDITTIFDLNKSQSLGIVNPDSYTFEFLENEITELNAQEKIRNYNVSACATDNGFVVLENGKTLKEIEDDSNSGRENVGLRICGYDWDGNCLFAHHVDKNIAYVAYNDSSRKLYVIDHVNGKLYNCILT